MIVVAVGVLCALYVTWLAARLSRLNARVKATASALSVAANRRACVAIELGEDLKEESVRAAAHAALVASDDRQIAAENDLTRALRKARGHTIDPDAWGQLEAVNRRLAVARQMHNDAVRDTLALRGARTPRGLRLASHLPRPQYFDIDTDLS
ncbi:MAG: hypothetical protein HOQ05_12465 [Corynebacteriales bacterium]|nr:hypothetical protein [Mycobacteriales bacterium]